MNGGEGKEFCVGRFQIEGNKGCGVGDLLPQPELAFVPVAPIETSLRTNRDFNGGRGRERRGREMGGEGERRGGGIIIT
jgi:hypothetical protein